MLEPSPLFSKVQKCAGTRQSRFLKHPNNLESAIGIFYVGINLFSIVDLGLKGSTAIKFRKEALKMLSRDSLSSFLIGYSETPKEIQRFILWIYVEGNKECDDFNQLQSPQ